jgi:hypothetical protein
MNKMAIFLITLASSVTFGQAGLIPGTNDPSKADLQSLTENKSLISTRIDPIKGQAEGYVVGYDEGSFDVDDLKLFIAELRGEIKSAFQHHPEETQFKMVTAVSAPTKTKYTKPKRKKHMKSSKYQQKI